MPRILQKIYLDHVKDIVNSYGFVNIDDCIQACLLYLNKVTTTYTEKKYDDSRTQEINYLTCDDSNTNVDLDSCLELRT